MTPYMYQSYHGDIRGKSARLRQVRARAIAEDVGLPLTHVAIDIELQNGQHFEIVVTPAQAAAIEQDLHYALGDINA